MDYSSMNTGLWSPIIQIAIVAGVILLANVMRRKIALIRNAMIPTAVLAGFIMLAGKFIGIIQVNVEYFEMLTYHAIAIGFIAMSLRTPEDNDLEVGKHIGAKSGAIIVSTYMVQGTIGLLVSLGLAILSNLTCSRLQAFCCRWDLDRGLVRQTTLVQLMKHWALPADSLLA